MMTLLPCDYQDSFKRGLLFTLEFPKLSLIALLLLLGIFVALPAIVAYTIFFITSSEGKRPARIMVKAKHNPFKLESI